MENDEQAKKREEEVNAKEPDLKQKDLTEINVAESKERKWKRQAKESRGGGY